MPQPLCSRSTARHLPIVRYPAQDCPNCSAHRNPAPPHSAAPLLSHPTPGSIEPHYRREALQFLHVCLASVLNLRSPEDSELPGTPLDRLTEMLLGNQPPPHVLPTPSRVSGAAHEYFTVTTVPRGSVIMSLCRQRVMPAQCIGTRRW